MGSKASKISDPIQRWKQRGLMVWTAIGLAVIQFALALHVLALWDRLLSCQPLALLLRLSVALLLIT